MSHRRKLLMVGVVLLTLLPIAPLASAGLIILVVGLGMVMTCALDQANTESRELSPTEEGEYLDTSLYRELRSPCPSSSGLSADRR